MHLELWLMRHATAEDVGPGPDEARQLIPEGRLEARAQAAELSRLRISFRCIVSSPLIRAIQTTDEVASILRYEGEQRLDGRLEPEVTLKAMIALVREEFDRFSAPGGRLLLVGHNPSIGQLKASLLGDHTALNFKKAAIYGFDFTPGRRGSPDTARLVCSLPKPRV